MSSFSYIVAKNNYSLFPPINFEINQMMSATPPKIKINAHHIPALNMVFTASQLVNKDIHKIAKNPSVNFFIVN